MKMSDLVGKHKKESCFKQVYGEPPLVHGAFTYKCEDCSEEWLMWLELGVEGEDKIMPSPFTIGCECGGWAEHIDWHKDIKLKSPRFLEPIERYFALNNKTGCGRPSKYMGIKVYRIWIKDRWWTYGSLKKAKEVLKTMIWIYNAVPEDELEEYREKIDNLTSQDLEKGPFIMNDIKIERALVNKEEFYNLP